MYHQNQIAYDNAMAMSTMVHCCIVCVVCRYPNGQAGSIELGTMSHRLNNGPGIRSHVLSLVVPIRKRIMCPRILCDRKAMWVHELCSLALLFTVWMCMRVCVLRGLKKS